MMVAIFFLSARHDRMKPIGVISDIQSAFHNIEINKEHRDYEKFLWLNLDDDKLMCYRFNRLPFGLSSSG